MGGRRPRHGPHEEGAAVTGPPQNDPPQKDPPQNNRPARAQFASGRPPPPLPPGAAQVSDKLADARAAAVMMPPEWTRVAQAIQDAQVRSARAELCAQVRRRFGGGLRAPSPAKAARWSARTPEGARGRGGRWY